MQNFFHTAQLSTEQAQAVLNKYGYKGKLTTYTPEPQTTTRT
jgi:hypothetical protein